MSWQTLERSSSTATTHNGKRPPTWANKKGNTMKTVIEILEEIRTGVDACGNAILAYAALVLLGAMIISAIA